MGLPKPSVELTGHCTVVYNSTLYAYSPSALQSIKLGEGGEWKELSMGVAVTGGVCVKAVSGDNAALYVVGGTVNDASLTSYPGIQKYTFASDSWEWVSPVVPVTQNRVNHAAIYLNSSSSILVYAGSQDGSTGLSSQTFVISTVAPYAVQAYTSSAPPATAPLLLPWTESQAVMVGGNADNKGVFTFDSSSGWQNLGVSLADGIHDQATTSCTVLSGDDGSKVLETYNMGSSPNTVSSTVLLWAGGTVAATGQTIGSKLKKRISIDNWPAYNSTLAPTATRSGFSLAQDDATKQVVVSGGNSDDPLCIFDQQKNAWINATELIVGKEVQQVSIQDSTSTSSPLTLATASPTVAVSTSAAATSGAAVSSSVDHKSRMLKVLGATLGTIFGIAALLLIILLLLRWKKQKRKEKGGEYTEKDGRLSFADRGAEYMREAGGSAGGHYSMPNAAPKDGHSSLSIMQGKIGHGNSHKRGIGPLGSDSSTAHLVPQLKKSPLAYTEPMEMSSLEKEMITSRERSALSPSATQREIGQPIIPSNIPNGPQHGHSRSSGWSKYFSNNEATNLANMTSTRSTFASDQLSEPSLYPESRAMSQPSQAPPPLDLDFLKFEGQRLSRVASGSPSLGYSREDLRGQPMQAELARAGSVSSSVSSLDDYDHVTMSNAQKPGTSNWTPMDMDAWNQRPPSSAYTDSNRDSGIPFKDGTSSYYPTDNKSSYYAKSGISTLYGLYGNKPEVGRDSTVTVFPRGIPDEDKKRVPVRPNGGPSAGQPSDMSWLNLGSGGN